jgi:predicted glycoside hydrolase/deacetylase ChbG (UPF0249 family)
LSNLALPLVEALGFAPSDPLLIVCCDDLGSSRSANAAIERGIRDGIASTASLMVPCPWSQAAASSCRDLDIGVHLTLTAEYPTYRWCSLTGLRSLHDPDGYLPQSSQEVWGHADLADVEAECRAQIDQALDWGLDITHLNSHMDVLQLDRHFFGVYMKLALDYRLPVRLHRSPFETPLSTISRSTLQRAGILAPDRLVAPPWGDSARKPLQQCLRKQRPGVTEIFLHPVEDGEELRAYDPEYGDLRVADAACLVDGELKAAVQDKCKLIGFRPMREAMRRQLSGTAASRVMQNDCAPSGRDASL